MPFFLPLRQPLEQRRISLFVDPDIPFAIALPMNVSLLVSRCSNNHAPVGILRVVCERRDMPPRCKRYTPLRMIWKESSLEVVEWTRQTVSFGSFWWLCFERFQLPQSFDIDTRYCRLCGGAVSKDKLLLVVGAPDSAAPPTESCQCIIGLIPVRFLSLSYRYTNHHAHDFKFHVSPHISPARNLLGLPWRKLGYSVTKI